MTRGSISAVAMLALLLAGAAFAQSPPKAPAPKELARNFDGVWTNATLTQLERSGAYSQLVVPKERADAVQKATKARQDAANGASDLSKGAFKDQDATAGYNSFWIDNGDGLMRVRGEARSSFITSPADGKMPFRNRAKSLALMIRDRSDSKLAIPFGPFLAIGALIALFWGDRIVAWYMVSAGFAPG